MTKSEYIFTGDCFFSKNTCAPGVTGCQDVTPRIEKCTRDSAGKYIEIKFTEYTFKDKYLRIKGTVKNPSVYTGSVGSVKFMFFSARSDLIYE